MSFSTFYRRYLFPLPNTKTIENTLEILVGDGKYTGTYTKSVNLFFWKHLTVFGLEFAMSIYHVHSSYQPVHVYKNIIYSWVFYIMQPVETSMEKIGFL